MSVLTKNINDDFFDGHYKDIWRSIIPEALTKAEVDYIINEGGLEPGAKVLDLMCGYGRHAVALARKGINVTAVDNLDAYVNEIREIAQSELLPITLLHGDVLQFEPRLNYDLVICLGNNLSFFDYDDSMKLFASIASCLEPNSKFIFNSWVMTEIVVKQFKEKSWSDLGRLKYLTDSQFLFSPARIETKTIFMEEGGVVETKKTIDYIYSLNETEAMLQKSGLMIKDIWSIPGKKKFSLGDPRIYVIAEKI